MIRTNNYITFLLTVIVIVLVLGVGVAIYYVLDLDWFDKNPVEIYNEVQPYVEQPKPIEPVKNFDMTKRKYDIELNTDEFKIVVYKDGSTGITMKENDKYKDIKNYTELLNKEIKVADENIVKVYEVAASKDDSINKCIVFIDTEGNLYKLLEESLIKDGKYDVKKIEGLTQIVDVKQITNTNVAIYKEGINVIAIDNKGNEILLTEYLLK